MRKVLLFGLVILTGISFVGRLFYLQIYTADAFDMDNDNAIRKVFHYPKRGYIYDRNDSLLVANQPSYDVMVIPREVEALDTLMFCKLLKIDKPNFLKYYNRAK
ncbi:penicillin-binding protein 2, partial [Flavobacteriaceae bacterium]|nr:penicillin-binding protein 2 [Flavobacteriaceae bacterium]